MTPPFPRRRAGRQAGTTLLEALVAFLVLSLGMLSVARLQTQLRVTADVGRQRAEAVRLGQEDVEKLRAFSVIAANAGLRAYADIVSAVRTIDADTGYATPTRYTLTRTVDAGAVAHAKAASVAVGWTDRSGAGQRIELHSVIAESNPLYSGALGLAPSGSPVKGAAGRSVRIPLGARNLGNGSSALKPVAAGNVALVFDNASGALSGRCSVSPAIATQNLVASDLTGCQALSGLLLSGVVRFAATSPPSVGQVSDTPLDLSVGLALSGGSYPMAPSCTSDPVAAGGDRYVAYHCVITPLASGQWSGRSTVVPSGWTVGTGAADRKVCRYSADLDASGAIDANAEHPAQYAAVDAPLAHQNFLVVRGVDACPLGSPVRVTGGFGDVYANLSTVQHQP